MKYQECIQSLNSSEEMLNIPDGWKMEAPIIFYEDGIRQIGYLFSRYGNGKATLKLMLGVSTDDGKVARYNTDKLKEVFQVNIEELDAICIKDYDIYFEQKEEQEAIMGDVVDDKAFSRERLLQLTQQLFSTEQYEEIVLRIGKDFYKQ